jgi:hypothetical protein
MNRYLLFMAGLLLLVGSSAASPVISAAIGEPVPLAGFAPGADVVYLFVTGPNLPVNGVRLDDIADPVTSGDPSSFTRLSVDDSRWEYTWYTRTKGGPPDAGTYTIYIVTTPVGRRDLAGSQYTTVMVSLGSPRIGMVAGGEVTIGASPQGSENGTNGTPIELQGVSLGDRTPDRGNRSDTGPDTPMNVTGTGDPLSPSVTASPLQTNAEKITFPILAVFAALTCAVVMERIQRE